MAMMMFICTNRSIMKQFVVSGTLKVIGSIATAIMTAAVGMIATGVPL
jgi:hypothetical protein